MTPATRAETAIAFLRELVAAQPAGEAAVQAIIARRLQQAGCIVTTNDYAPSEVPVVGEFAHGADASTGRRVSVVGTLEGRSDLPSLLIFAHPDAEPALDAHTWTHNAYAGEIENGRFYGWGVADDLAGCAAAVLAIEAVAATGLPLGRAVFASTPSKRHARGVAALLHAGLAADAAIYLHPAESGKGMREIKALASGHITFTITVQGKGPDTAEPSHTAFSHLAVNPVQKAFLVVEALNGLADARAARVRNLRIEAEVGRATNLMVSRIQCGEMQRFSRIADHCTLGCALSFPPGETLRDVMAEVEGAIALLAASDPWLAAHPPVINWMSGETGAEVAETHPLYLCTARAVSAVTGDVPFVNPMHTSSDIRNPAVEAGIPCVAFGCLCGDLSQNERRDEWVDVNDFLRMVDVTTRVVTDWCSGAHAG